MRDRAVGLAASAIRNQMMRPTDRPTPLTPSPQQNEQIPIPLLIVCCGFATCLAGELGSHSSGHTVYAIVYLAGLVACLTTLTYQCWRADRKSLAMLLPALLLPLCIVLWRNCDLTRMLLWLYYAAWCMWTAYRSAKRSNSD